MSIRNRAILFAGLVFVGAALVTASATAQESDYVGHKKCKMCHNKKAEGAAWSQWSASSHANAFASLFSDAAKKYATEAGLATPASESSQCIRCHVTGYDADKNAFHPAGAKENGVQCESCHGPSSKHLAYGKKMMMKKDNIDPSIPTDIIRPDEATCLKCHNEESPAWKPEKYELEDGTKTGFDFEQAFEKITHLNPLKKRD